MMGLAGRMRSWIFEFNTFRRLLVPGRVLTGVLLLMLSGGWTPSEAAPWQWNPYLTFGTGHESDRILDPDLDRTVVPGGVFLDLAPGVTLTNQLKPGTFFKLNGQLFLERFLNQAGRSVVSGLLTGDLVAPGGGPGQWRQ